ncbi:hypothetical protein [uncultured Nostoc sp.]
MSIAIKFWIAAPLVLSTSLTPAQADNTHNHSDDTGFYFEL